VSLSVSGGGSHAAGASGVGARPAEMRKLALGAFLASSDWQCGLTRSLVVMAKRPAAGATKTRLVPTLMPEQAANLYECFLLDALQPW